MYRHRKLIKQRNRINGHRNFNRHDSIEIDKINRLWKIKVWLTKYLFISTPKHNWWGTIEFQTCGDIWYTAAWITISLKLKLFTSFYSRARDKGRTYRRIPFLPEVRLSEKWTYEHYFSHASGFLVNLWLIIVQTAVYLIFQFEFLLCSTNSLEVY